METPDTCPFELHALARFQIPTVQFYFLLLPFASTLASPLHPLAVASTRSCSQLARAQSAALSLASPASLAVLADVIHGIAPLVHRRCAPSRTLTLTHTHTVNRTQAPSAHPHRASPGTSRPRTPRTSTHGSWAAATRARSRSTSSWSSQASRSHRPSRACTRSGRGSRPTPTASSRSARTSASSSAAARATRAAMDSSPRGTSVRSLEPGRERP